ncbi:hypothetical protein [Rhodococcus opacus]|uniref:hypothetical protein n=1 Tax=Rhodococcus opacus TaxID=37919 RepID=UPI001D0194EE|nr:hypothetical protein [Rhodococcus opacus]
MDFVDLGDQERGGAGDTDVVGAVIVAVEGGDGHDGVVDDAAFEAGGNPHRVLGVRRQSG